MRGRASQGSLLEAVQKRFQMDFYCTAAGIRKWALPCQGFRGRASSSDSDPALPEIAFGLALLISLLWSTSGAIPAALRAYGHTGSTAHFQAVFTDFRLYRLHLSCSRVMLMYHYAVKSPP